MEYAQDKATGPRSRWFLRFIHSVRKRRRSKGSFILDESESESDVASIGFIGIQFAVYIKATAAATKIKEKNRFCFRF